MLIGTSLIANIVAHFSVPRLLLRSAWCPASNYLETEPALDRILPTSPRDLPLTPRALHQRPIFIPS